MLAWRKLEIHEIIDVTTDVTVVVDVTTDVVVIVDHTTDVRTRRHDSPPPVLQPTSLSRHDS